MNPNDDYIPHSRPTLGRTEIEALSKVMATGQIAQGPEVERFEREFADHFGFSNALAASSGTAALHLALIGLGAGAGDEVIIPDYVCTALLNAVNYVGAMPVVADVDPRTGNMDAKSVKMCVSARTRAIIVPHMFGLPVDLQPLSALGIPIVEDCAQSIGALSNRKPVGATGDVAIFSFFATKMLATGEGGMVVCRSADMAKRLRDLRSYDERPDYLIRYNYKLTDIQAALGRCQLARLDKMISRRQAIAALYRDGLRGAGPALPPEPEGRIFFRYVIGVDANIDAWVTRMHTHGIGCARPVHRLLSAHLGLDNSLYPGAGSAYRHLLSIPIYPSLSDSAADRVIAAVRRTQLSLR